MSNRRINIVHTVLFATLSIVALALAFALKKEDKRKGYGLEEANIKQ